jgi:hypothetical protein
MVTYELRAGGPIVFTVEVDGFGPVVITSRKPQIFNGRLNVAPVLKKALRIVEDFAERNKQELAVHYASIAEQDGTANLPERSVPAEKCA